jgi:hypothetical protein
MIGIEQIPIDTLVISKGIEKVNTSAFEAMCANTVVWPSSCPVIPTNCFYGSTIRHFKGMENVQDIQNKAFYKVSELEEFSWPEGCEVIPYECFGRSRDLKRIIIPPMPHFEIRAFAFKGTSLKEADLSQCITCNIDQNAFGDKVKIIEPFYT